MMYFGDDFGGHNIPFPHPAPPKPHKMYDQHAFIDLSIVLKPHTPTVTPPSSNHTPLDFGHGHTKIPSQFLEGEKEGLQAGLTDGYSAGVKDSIGQGSVGGTEVQQTAGYAKPVPSPETPTPATTATPAPTPDPNNQGYSDFDAYYDYGNGIGSGYGSYGEQDPFDYHYGAVDYDNGFNKAGPIQYDAIEYGP